MRGGCRIFGCLFAAALVSGIAHAAPVAGAASYMILGDCPAVPDFTVIQGPGGPQLCQTVPFSGVVAPGETAAEEFQTGVATAAYASSLTLGSSIASGSVQMTGFASLPVLGATAISNDRYTVVFSSFGATQIYTYQGAAPVALPLEGSITFASDVPTSHSFVQLSAILYVTDMSFTPSLSQATCATPGVIALRQAPLASWGSPLTLSLGNDCSGSPLTISPGQQFSVIMGLSVLAYREGEIDASHTFSVDLDSSVSQEDRELLASSLVPELVVPEPDLSALVLTATLAIAGLRYRRRHLGEPQPR